jgi:hypothetical protein
MIKLVCLLKRKPGMPFDDFIRYYEEQHAKLAASHLEDVRHYERRFIRPYGNPVDGQFHEADFDVVTEIWFDDRATLDRVMGKISQPEIAAAFAADEENLFDRAFTRLFTVESEAATIRASPEIPGLLMTAEEFERLTP